MVTHGAFLFCSFLQQLPFLKRLLAALIRPCSDVVGVMYAPKTDNLARMPIRLCAYELLKRTLFTQIACGTRDPL